MRPLLKTLLLVLGIAALVLLTKGFPQLRAVLKMFLHPVGLIVLGLLGFWIYWIRTRPARDHARIIDNSPKRIAPPPIPPQRENEENEHA